MLLKIKAYEQSIDKRGNIITGYLKEKIKLTNNQGYKEKHVTIFCPSKWQFLKHQYKLNVGCGGENLGLCNEKAQRSANC